MPNRILREGILTSPRISKLGWSEEVFYRRLMSVVDDFGRYYADPGMLRAACYPRQLSKVTDPDIGKWTRNLAEAGLVRVYPAQDGESYIELLDFRQQARAKASKFPDPLSTCVANATQTPSKPPADAPVFEDVSVDGGGGGNARARATLDAPTDEHERLAAEQGVNCQAEFRKYRDWLAANGRRQRDEIAGFRNWLRKAGEFRARDSGKPSLHDKRAATAAAMQAHRTTDHDEPHDITAEVIRVA
jgi:hypothetical protein